MVAKRVGQFYSSIHAPKAVRLCIEVREDAGLFLSIYPDISVPIQAEWDWAKEIEIIPPALKRKAIRKLFRQ